MQIPEPKERLEFYVDLVNKCEVSQPDRAANYESYRRYFLQGSLGNQKNVMQNRLRDKVNLLSAFLYAQETTKFDVKFAAHVPPEQKLYADVMRQVALDDWHDTDTDRSFGDAVTWSLVDGCFLKKVIWTKHGLETYPLEPGNFGVLREDTDRIAHQEALCQTYHITKSELRRQLWGHPNKEDIISRLTGSRKDENATIPSSVSKMIISQVSPNMIGSANVDGQGLRQDYLAVVEEELVEMRELWVWDDSLKDGEGDYRIWTAALPDITIYDRPNMFVPQEHPFIKICPVSIYNYFWGFSMVGALQGLQDWRDKRLSQIDQTLVRQLRPSRFGIGAGPLTESKLLAIDSPGGYHNFNQPNAKIETYKPELPPDAWQLIANIDEQMNEIMGITKTVAGRGEEGVRSEGHAQFLGKMSSAPIRKLSLLIEDAIEDEATLMLRVRARESKQEYLSDKDDDKKPKKFLLSQVSPDYRVRVSAHSSSPIFAEENRQAAEALFKAGAIDKRTLVEMLDPPLIDTILARLPALEEGQAKIAQLQAQQEASKTEKNVATAQVARAKVGLVPRAQ